MAGYNDLLLRCQPYWFELSAAGTEGADWKFRLEGIVDDAGTAIDMSTGITAVCTIVDSTGGPAVATLTYTGGSGYFELSATAANTAGLASANAVRRCCWSLKLTKASIVVKAFGSVASSFDIYPEG